MGPGDGLGKPQRAVARPPAGPLTSRSKTQLIFDGKLLGEFSKTYVDDLREGLNVRPHATTLGRQPFLDTDYQQCLLSVDSYDPSQHCEFRGLIEGRLRLEIQYESIYGGEGFTLVYPPHG